MKKPVKTALLFSLLAGIFVLSISFIFVSCGKDPQLKVQKPDMGPFAIDLSLAPAENGVAFIANDPLPSIAGEELTIEAWVKSKTNDLEGAVFGPLQAGGAVLFVKNNEAKFAIRRQPTPAPELRCTNFNPSSTECIVNSNWSMPFDDNWYHLAGVLVNEDHSAVHGSCSSADVSEAETPHMDFYVNGEFMNCATTESRFSGNSVPDDHLMAIGSVGAANPFPLDGNIVPLTRFDGVIDEVRLWTVARTQAQIQACMFQELSFEEKGDCYMDTAILKGYWPLNEGAGHFFAEYTGSGAIGVIESFIGIGWDGGWVKGFNN